MSPRTLLSLLWGVTLCAGCGVPEEAPDEGLGFELRMSQAVASDVGSFQLVVLRDSPELQCDKLQSRCLREQVRTQDLVLLEGPDGKKARALRFSAALTEGYQSTRVGLPVGRDYLVIIEALSRTSPPRFLGSSCNHLRTVSATGNPNLVTNEINLANAPAVDCNPTIEP